VSNTQKPDEAVAGTSLKIFLVRILALLLLGTYLSIVIYGENSYTVLKQLKDEKNSLSQQERILKVENQRLQKEYFELKQLEPKDNL